MKEIEKFEFLQNKEDGKYGYVFGQQNLSCSKYYEVELSQKLLVGLISSGALKPSMKRLKKYFAVMVDNEIYFIDIKDEIVIKTLILNSFAYDIIEYYNKFIILGEIDILVIDSVFNIEQKVELSDILSKYKIENDVLIYTTFDNDKKNILNLKTKGKNG